MTQPPPYGQPAPPPPYGPPQEDVVLPVLAHLSYFVLPLLGPLALYLISGDGNRPMTRHHATEALNFHLSLLIYAIASAILILVIVGIVLLIALAVASVVLTIVAAVAAGDRRPYRYPLTVRMIR